MKEMSLFMTKTDITDLVSNEEREIYRGKDFPTALLILAFRYPTVELEELKKQTIESARGSIESFIASGLVDEKRPRLSVPSPRRRARSGQGAGLLGARRRAEGHMFAHAAKFDWHHRALISTPPGSKSIANCTRISVF